ncbi:MAG: hypothetical protein KBT11_10935 [Treponema sp.]|nr:hypothetical protein [Candidatus Treponema equifaecale]
MANGSFFSKLFGSLFSGKDAEAEKKKQLKAIAKTLSKSRYKFYKGDQALPAFGKFFYDIYKAISGCQAMFNNQPNPNFYKTLAVDGSLSEAQKKLIEELTEESIQTKSSSVPFDQLKAKVKADLDTFTGEFDQQKIMDIDATYTQLMTFKAFCTFDYYFILKKFDSTIQEGEFSRTPKFNSIDASYIADDIKDFLSVLWTLPLNEDWGKMLNLFKASKGVEPIKPALWAKIVQRLSQLKNSCALEMIVQLATKDPGYVVQADIKHEQIVETYIDNVRKQATTAINKLENAQQNSKIDSLVTQIFNTSSVQGLKYYTEANSANYTKKNLAGFTYARPLNYIKAFLLEYVKKDVREYADLVLIRGKWSTAQLSAEMSEAYNSLLETSEKITAFDTKLNENNGEFGTKLKTLLPRADRDKEAANIIKTTLRDCNDIAKEFVVRSTQNLINFAKNTKALIEDYQKPHPEMLINWKELERFSEKPIKDMSVEVYKKIYLIVNLMQSLLGSGQK